MENLLTALGALAALILSFLAGKAFTEKKSREKTGTAQTESNTRVDNAEKVADYGREEANNAHENSSDSDVVNRFNESFSKNPRDRK